MDIPLAAILPLAIAAIAWLAFCFVDLARSEVRWLPKWGWALIILLSIPIGGIAYLLVAKEPK